VNNNFLIFIHIPKSGGTTLRSIVDRQFSQGEVVLCYAEGEQYEQFLKQLPSMTSRNPKIKCIYGHLYFGMHNYVEKPSTYITMLRNPIEQVISNYYHIKMWSHPLHHEANQMSLDEFCEKYKKYNFQTRLLSGINDFPNLNIAKQNLKKYFSIVGVTEMFCESAFLMKKELNWSNISYQKLNINRHRPIKENLPQNVVNLIEMKSQLDIELYAYAKQLLEERINSLDSESKKQLEIFKRNYNKA
jgi:hypothetical protein